LNTNKAAALENFVVLQQPKKTTFFICFDLSEVPAIGRAKQAVAFQKAKYYVLLCKKYKNQGFRTALFSAQLKTKLFHGSTSLSLL
jgi:hypothetical protein